MTIPIQRPYQLTANLSIVRSLELHQNRVLIKMPTGCGKTVCFAALPKLLEGWIAAQGIRGARMLVIAHREELLTQAQAKIQAANPGLAVSIEQGDLVASRYSDVIVASIQTLSARKFTRLLRLIERHDFRLVIVDECFPAGTLVDGRAIECLLAGDVVTSYDPSSGVVAQKRVVRTMSRRPSSLVAILSGGRRLVCTPSHKIQTRRGWVAAESLRPSDMMVSITEAQNEDSARNDRQVSLMPRPDGSRHEETDRHVQSQRKGVLLDRLSRCLGFSKLVSAHGEDEPQVRVGAHEGTEPDALRGGACEDVGHASSDWVEAAFTGRQRPSFAASAGGLGTGVGLAGRGSDSNEALRENSRPISDELQVGHRGQRLQGGRRSGRELSLLAESLRCEEGPLLRWTRVDHLEVLEPGSDGEFGGVCPGGLVYNLEVEDFHTYTANGFVVSNCHHAAAATYRTALALLGFLPKADITEKGDIEAATHDDVVEMEQALQGWDVVSPKDRLLVGVTATPNRTDAIGLGAVFQSICFSYALRQAIEDGWLVPIKPWVVETNTSLDKVRTTAGEFNQKDLAETVNTAQRNALAARALRQYAPTAPTLAFSVDVQHAHDLAAAFVAEGFTAQALSGETPKEERRQMLRAYTEGRVQIITNCMVLTEGTDLPLTGCILHAKPTKSATLYEQMTGRGLRIHPGKTECIVIDVVDVARRHSLQTAPILYGLPPAVTAKGRDLRELADDLEKFREEYPNFDLDAALKDGTLSVEQLRLKVKTFDVWSVPTLGDLAGVVTMNWIRYAADSYRLQYPYGDGTEVLTVSGDLLGHFDLSCTLRPRGGPGGWSSNVRQRTIATQIPTAVAALQLAEQFLDRERASVKKLKDKDAPWRKRPASEKQVALLQKLRIPYDPRKVTMGQASDLIDLSHARKGR